MKLNFVKTSPAKNTTVLITDYVSPEHYREISDKVMSYEYLLAEQVGFIVQPFNNEAQLRLEMSGNEFCGNAVLSAAAYVIHKGISHDRSFYIESSGFGGLLSCEATIKPGNVLQIKAEMPKPDQLEDLELDFAGVTVSGCLVNLPGISHFVTDHCLCNADYFPLMELLALRTAAKAIGIIAYQKVMEKEYKILPYVYVRDSDTRVFEQACGSGSLSLGAYIHRLEGEGTLLVGQPGGLIIVETGVKSYLTADVFFTCEGSVDIG